MPKFFNLLRSQKRRSSLPLSSPLGKKKKNGIFRSATSSRKSTEKLTIPPVIEAAITYSLSEDEESCDIMLSSDIDIENQFSAEELDRDNVDVNKNIVEISSPDIEESVEPESIERGNENDKTMTFTHLEIMRNELAHIMQIANKDKEIGQLKHDTEEMKILHSEILASKDAEIARIKSDLEGVESALLLSESMLASEEKEHSKTIELLMKTQYEYHELNAKPWFQPLLSYF